MLAYEDGRPPLGPEADPEGWSVFPPLNVSGTLFNTRPVNVQYSVSVHVLGFYDACLTLIMTAFRRISGNYSIHTLHWASVDDQIFGSAVLRGRFSHTPPLNPEEFRLPSPRPVYFPFRRKFLLVFKAHRRPWVTRYRRVRAGTKQQHVHRHCGPSGLLASRARQFPRPSKRQRSQVVERRNLRGEECQAEYIVP